MTLLPDGSLASGSSDKTIRIWDPKSLQTIKKLIGHYDRVNSLVLLPDGRLVSCSDDKINKIWNKKIIFLVINNKKKAMIKYWKKERKGES